MKLPRHAPWLLALVPILLGLARLRFDVEVLNLLPSDVAAVQGLKIYQQNFSNARELIITVEGPDADETESAARSLARFLHSQTNLVTHIAWQPSWMEDPALATELIAFLWLNQPPAVFGQLTNRLAVTQLTNTLTETRQRLATSLSPNEFAAGSYDPFGLLQLPESVSGSAPALGSGEELFASRDGTFRLVFVEAKPDLTSYRACRSWLSEIQRLIAAAQRSGQVPAQAVLHYTGRPAFVTEIAGGMENDLGGSSGGTLATIGILFWLTHRRLRPLFWLLLLLLSILAGTVAFGGLFFGTLNVVSLGFAAILLGLAEDFGILVYQESRSHPQLNAGDLRREVAPGVFWSAVTTAGAFLTLNLSTLPGLGQLGSLVAIGIIVAAVVMLWAYLPVLLRIRRPTDRVPPHESQRERFLLFEPVRLLPPRFIWCVTGLVLAGSIAVLATGGVRFDRSPNALEPKHSEAKAALARIKSRMQREQEPLWVLVPGKDEAEVGQRFTQTEAVLRRAASNQLITGFTLPTALWPQVANQQANRPALAALLPARSALQAAAVATGFTTNALAATEALFNCWQRAAGNTTVFWPTNRASQWLLGKFLAHTGNGLLALGWIYPATGDAAKRKLAAEWPAELQREGIVLSGWELLGTTVFDLVMRELPRVVIPIFVLVVVSLWLAFRKLDEVMLSLGTLGFSGLLLGASMNLLHWDWNLMSLMALPLMLGMGVDFSIHMQLALRRSHGDRWAVRRSAGRALLLAGATTVAGFGSLAFSTNAGMASLGKVCALGISLALATAVYLLPVWWKTIVGRESRVKDRAPQSPPAQCSFRTVPLSEPVLERGGAGDTPDPSGDPPTGTATSNAVKRPRSLARAIVPVPSGESPDGTGESPVLPAKHLSNTRSTPSSLYRAEFWRLGLAAARCLSHQTCARLSRSLAVGYWALARRRRAVVVGNLLPPLEVDRAAAEKISRDLFRNFAVKLADLWRYESGQPIDCLFSELTGWDYFTQAQATGRGVLLLTPHLGNWEFGAPLLAQRGVKLLVITLAEPQGRLTEMRLASRARWGIETLVIGRDPFAFVEIIRRLEAGATVALLMDRPPEASAVLVELFGHKFAASIAAAELARAAGCVLLPVYLPLTDQGYAAHILPQVPYDRAGLRSREARLKLTQEIMRAFEGPIRQHLDQWYHFVPIWP